MATEVMAYGSYNPKSFDNHAVHGQQEELRTSLYAHNNNGVYTMIILTWV